ncbi:MAG: IS1380 family transposase, partial [Acidimicrobiia bacterium]|nr:IS1380 family transposase [Acidimicrobiia bacterium]
MVRPRTVTGGGEGLCSRAGLWWLAEVADQLGLTARLRWAMRRLLWRDHHPGTTMAVMILALADGATAMSDMAMLRGLRTLFGPVASTATLWRTFNRIGPAELRDLACADAEEARVTAWALEPSRSRIVIDIDATIVTCRSDKQDAAGTWKRSFGFHPLVAMDTERREILAQMVRPGNAGSNTAADHVQVLAAAIDALPEAERAGHDWDDNPEAVCCEIVIRSDSSGATHWLAEEATDRNCRFSLGYAINDRVRLAVEASMALDDTTTGAKRRWAPAIEADGEPRDGAEVADLTDFVDLSSWPEGTRLIVRRERAHPGAQLSLFDDIEGRRHTAFITNQAGDAPVLELAHRQRGAAEDVIRDLKACGYNNWPSEDIVNNQAWALCSAMAFNLLSRAQRLTLTGPYRTATPKTIRPRLPP